MFNKITPLQKLQSKSQNALDIFSKTKLDLNDINEEINKQKKIVGDQLAALMKEQDDLVKIEESNTRIIANIDKFFE